jgi:alkylation response protein AidB-like acyl-CoA dehydrogenase
MVETAILLEELGRAAYPGPYFPTVLAAAAVEAAGTDAQKKRWLSAIATGDARATLAFLDSDLDWDPAAVTTRAEKSSKGWTLSGTKRFVPWAHVANVLLIPARAPKARRCSSSIPRRQGSSSRRCRAWIWRHAGFISSWTRCRWPATPCSALPVRPRRS